MARAHARSAIRTLAHIAAQSENHAARVAAANSLLDRAFGKAPQAITGADGEGAIAVVIRHIIEGRDGPVVQAIEHEPADRPMLADGQAS